MFCPPGAAAPVAVAPGWFSVGGGSTTRTATVQCAVGFYCIGDGGAVACPAGTYGGIRGLASPACSGPCDWGFACPAGATASNTVPCPAGWYCELGAQPAPCPAGTANPGTGAGTAAACGYCLAGTVSGGAAAACMPCPPSMVSASGAAACTQAVDPPAPPGTDALLSEMVWAPLTLAPAATVVRTVAFAPAHQRVYVCVEAPAAVAGGGVSVTVNYTGAPGAVVPMSTGSADAWLNAGGGGLAMSIVCSDLGGLWGSTGSSGGGGGADRQERVAVAVTAAAGTIDGVTVVTRITVYGECPRPTRFCARIRMP